MHPNNEIQLKQYKGKWNRHWEGIQNLQNILKSAANESLGATKRRNRRKYLKIWDDQIKQLIETKNKSYKNGWLQRKTSLDTTEVRRRQKLFWDKYVTNLERETYRAQHKVYKILKQISNDVKRTARIQGNIEENVFLKYYENYGTQQT